MNQARKRTGTKKVLSMILVLVMLLSLLSMAAFTLPASETGNSKDSYEYNIMFLDCGRKYYSVDSIKQIIDNASAAGFNYIQLAVGNDGLRFLLDDMSLTVNGTTYDSNDVKSAIHAGNEKYYNFDVDELTQSEMNTIIAYAKTKGMGVIPCVNTPGHMDAILSAANSLTGKTCSYSGSVRTIDVTNTTAVAFTKALLQKYITYFAGKGCKLFNMGADEYANDKFTGGSMGFGNLQSNGKYGSYVTYVNEVAAMIKNAGMKPMAFNDGIYFNNNTYSGTFDTDIIICYWSSGWSGYSPMSASELASKGFRLVNTNGSYYWVLGKSDAQCDANKAKGFNKNSFPDKNSTSGNSIISNPAGSMFCIWADYPGAETEESVISKTAATIAAFGAALPKVTSGTVTPTPTPTPTTPTPDTSTKTEDINVAVNGTKTVPVPGDFSGTYTTADPDIATVTTNVTTTAKKLNAVTSIESGNQYLIVNNDANKALSDTTATTTFWSWFVDHNVSGLALSGSVSAENTTDLWTIESVGTKYQIKNASGQYLTFGEYSASVGATDSELSLSYSGGSWTIKNGKSYLSRYDATTNDVSAGYNSSSTSNNWTIYEITGGETTTTLTFAGHSVGDTSVKIGGVTYQIHVTKELPADVLTADTITLEHWITNARVAATSGATGDDRNVQKISKTTAGIQSKDGVAVETLAYVPGYWDKTAVHYWQAVRLDKDHLQTADGGSDQTDKGTTLTHIRYYGGAWQYETADGVWHYFLSTDQFVIYYLQKTEVTKEVDTYVKDWGFDTDKTTPDWSEGKGQVALTFAVVYPDGTVSPAEGSMYASSTTIFNYWDGRDIGIVAPKNNSDYNIAKITVTDGKRDSNSSSNVWYTTDTITWNKKTNVAGEKWYDETEVWNKSSGTTPMVNGHAKEITWSAKNTAKLVLIYLEPVEKETNLNVQYIDLNANNYVFHSYQVAMKYNQGDPEPKFNEKLMQGDAVIGDKGPWNSNVPDTPNYLPEDAYVTNSSGTKQTFRKDITTFPEINGIYASGLYKYMKADISEDGKTLRLYYDLKATGGKTFVVDFGLPVEIPFDDFGITNASSNVTVSFDATDTKKTERTGSYGVGKIDMTAQTVTYTLYKTLDAKAPIPVYVSDGTNTLMRSVNIIPATSVYYEDSFAQFTDGKGNASAAKWTTDKDGTAAKATTTQALSALGSKDVYGHDAAYADSTKLSMGSARKVTVSKDMYVKGDTTTTWPTATFTFKGTGFDVISLTSSTSGSVVYTVTGKNTGTTETNLVDTYYGYKLVGNEWVVDQNSNSTLYQIPVIKVAGLPYDEYTVTLSVRYGEFFDHKNAGEYSFWFDAIRVYDPMGKDNDTYKQDNEGYPQYIKLRDALVTENVKTTLFIDGAAEANITAYKNYGPNNEVYLSNGQAITFTVPKNAKIASIQIGAKAPDGSAAKMNVNGTETNISSATEMYYEIGTEGQNFTIANKGNGILSLTDLKITFKDKPDSTIALTPLSTEEQNAAVMSVRALFAAPEQTFEPEHFTATWSRNVRKGGTATLTVKASADVKSITVNGEEIIAYTTKTARSFWGPKETYHVFTYRVTNAATANYTVCALNGEGVASDPITATLTVRPSIRDWWNGIFDKWKH